MGSVGIRITVPGVPQAKGRPRIGKGPGGHAMAFTPKETRKAEAVLRALGIAAMGDQLPFDQPVKLHLLATLPFVASWTKRQRAEAEAGTLFPTKKPDIDNIVKLGLDALNGVAFLDDRLVVEIRARKVYGAVPSTVIWVVPLEGDTP